MAVTTHIVKVRLATDSGERVPHVVADGGVAHSSGSPTLAAYLALEAGDDFIPVLCTDYLCMTVDAGTVNAAS